MDAPMDAGRDSGPDAGTQCIPFQTSARPAPLDLFVLMDSSGSMQQETAAGLPKIDAVSEALRGFVRADESDGLGVALTFFPIIDESVPRYCDRDSECGIPDACFEPDICLANPEIRCRTGADCPGGSACLALGRCAGAEDAFCYPGFNEECPEGSRCVDFGECRNRSSCEVDRYAQPPVEIGTLPGRSSALISAAQALVPKGFTPTRPALEGTLRRAERRAEANPGHKVVVLLATDGFPTDCDPTIDLFGEPDPNAGIPMVVDAAADGLDSNIQTFVVGVFAPDEEMDARRNLSRVARAGGTEEALIITTAEPVDERLLEVLNDVRTSIRTCTYAIPAPGALPDPEELQVRIRSPSGESTELERRRSPGDCDPETGGYFFEQELGEGERPGYVELCPASCDQTASGPGYTVEMEAGCNAEP
jgi:hypothetical protein